jgi:predicted kinase
MEPEKMLIAMVGLPSSGKTSIALSLAKELGAVVLDKDRVRSTLFPPPVLNYSREQDDICMTAIYTAANSILKSFPQQAVIIDGRTYLRSYQLCNLLALFTSLDQSPCLIECVCDDEVAKNRLEKDLAQGTHPAGNRTFDLYRSLKSEAEPIQLPHLVLDTGKMDLEECVRKCLVYVQHS